MAKTKKTAIISKKPLPEHELIIDEYFRNGFNKTQAVLSVRPDLSPGSAAVTFNILERSAANELYIEEKKARLKASADIEVSQVVREMINLSFSDITMYMGLSEAELKELPPEARRCIQSFKTTEHYDKHGNHTGTTTELKLADKKSFVNMLNKYIGTYEQDNKQKASKINLNSIDKAELNVMLNVLNKAKEK